MENMKGFFQRDAFAAHLGMELVEISPGQAVTRMQVQDQHCNTFGMAHGAVIFALADFAFEAACNSHGTVAVALNVSISFLKAAGRGPLTARATEVSRGNRIGTYDIRVTDEGGDLVATFQGMAYRKQDPIPWPQ
jgi:acyl-CoA thioesterase